MYFRVQYRGSNKKDVLNLVDSTQVGKVYRRTDNNQVFKVLGKANFKYTLDELDTLRVMLEGYTAGPYYELHNRVCEALIRGVPNIRISSLEKDYLGYIYINSGYCNEEEKKLLIKITNIDQN